MARNMRRTVCGLDELSCFREASVTHVLSILDPGTPEPEDFGLYEAHERLTLRFHDIIEPQPAMVLPEQEHIDALLDFGAGLPAGEGVLGHLLVHCHMGLSRSTAAMATLLAQAQPEASAEEIFDQILEIRPQAWPNSRMIRLVDARLGRQGELTAAVARVYAHQLTRHPEFAAIMRELRRGAEVDMAQAAS